MKLLSLFLVSACVSCSSAPGPVVPKTRVERQMIGLLEKFDRWDYNGDGFLTVSELGPARRIAGHEPAEIIDFYDTNKDARISLKEAQSGYSRAAEAEQIIKARP